MLSALAICVGAGILVAFADIFVRLPLHLPGWRGLLTVALLVAARLATGRVWAASAAAVAAMAMGSALGGSHPLSAGELASGLVIDALCLLAPLSGRRPAFLAVVGGCANAAKFVVAVLLLAGPGEGSVLELAALPPLTSHFAFGAAGALLAWFCCRERTPGGRTSQP